MAEKKITPRAPEKAEQKTSKTAAARVSKKTAMHKRTAVHKRARKA